MNFEEWCNSIGMEDSRIVASDMVSMTILKECWDYQQNIINQLKEELRKERSAVDDMSKMFNKCRDNNCNCVNDIAFYRQKERVNFE